MAKYFTSDWHFNELRKKTIILGKSLNFSKLFSSVKEQDEAILRGLNNTVKMGDTLYVIGDVSKNLEGIKLVDRIKCKNRILIKGNHDEDKLEELARYFDELKEDMELDVKGIPSYLVHYPVYQRDDRFNIVGHIHGSWRTQPNVVNVGVDIWDFKPVSEEEISNVYRSMADHNRRRLTSYRLF